MDTTKAWTTEAIIHILHQRRDELYARGARSLGLFGSYARGDQTSESDMDFVVALARPSYRDYSNVKFFLEDLFGVSIDLVTEKGIKPELRAAIMSEVIYVPELQGVSERLAQLNPKD